MITLVPQLAKRLMMVAVLLLNLFFSSCGTVQTIPNNLESQVEPDLKTVEHIPGFDGTIQISTGASFDKNLTRAVLFLFWSAWLDNFPEDREKLFDILNNLTIVWEPKNWTLNNVTAFGEGGQKKEKQAIRVKGLTVNKGLIRVSADEVHISETALVHEIVHVVIWNLIPGSRGDPDHLGTQFQGWTYKHSALKDIVNSVFARSHYESIILKQ